MVQRLLSWRIAVGVAISAALLSAGVAAVVSVAIGAAIWVALAAGGPRGRRSGPTRSSRERLDPFTVGEPWRQLVQGATRAADRLHATVADTRDGPLRDRLVGVAERLDHGVAEAWRIARRGDELDAAIRRLDPTALRSKLQSLREQQAAAPSESIESTIESVEQQLATTERLAARSAETAASLRLAQTRLDELASRATEISIGAGDTDAYEHDVEDLVIELEAVRQAIQEVQPG